VDGEPWTVNAKCQADCAVFLLRLPTASRKLAIAHWHLATRDV
jgi:hypothetical protein